MGLFSRSESISARRFTDTGNPGATALLVTSGWRSDNETRDFFARFAGSDCRTYDDLGMRHFRQEWEPSPITPPDILPTFLGLYVVTPTTEDWQPRETAG
jgi:hypothetical protein